MNEELKIHYSNIFYNSISKKQLKIIQRRIALFNYLDDQKKQNSEDEVYLNVKKQWKSLLYIDPLLNYTSKRILERDIEALLQATNIQERKDTYFDKDLNKNIPNSKLLTINSNPTNLITSFLKNYYLSSLIDFSKKN